MEFMCVKCLGRAKKEPPLRIIGPSELEGPMTLQVPQGFGPEPNLRASLRVLLRVPRTDSVQATKMRSWRTLGLGWAGCNHRRGSVEPGRWGVFSCSENREWHLRVSPRTTTPKPQNLVLGKLVQNPAVSFPNWSKKRVPKPVNFFGSHVTL